MLPANRITTENHLLAALPREILDRLDNDLHPVTLLRQQILYEAGARFEEIYFIEQGVTSLLTSLADGATIETGMIGSEGLTGVQALLGAEVSSQQVIVQVVGQGLRMSAARCKRAFEEHPDLRRPVLRFAESLLDMTAQTAACNRVHSIEQRCARWLLMASDRIRSGRLPMTQEFLSAMLGARRSGVTATIGELQRSGLIRHQRGVMTIVDRDSLAASACECYQSDRQRLEQLIG
jgi:CRP-like cAMP-binding protein